MYYSYDIKLYTIVHIKSLQYNFEVIMNMNRLYYHVTILNLLFITYLLFVLPLKLICPWVSSLHANMSLGTSLFLI